MSTAKLANADRDDAMARARAYMREASDALSAIQDELQEYVGEAGQGLMRRLDDVIHDYVEAVTDLERRRQGQLILGVIRGDFMELEGCMPDWLPDVSDEARTHLEQERPPRGARE
jgi:hypothetical protein